MIDFLSREPAALLLVLFAIALTILGSIYRWIIWSPPIPMQREIVILGLTFVEVGPISPEQYDVYDRNELVGYVRYRFGYLSAEYPEVGMEEVFGRQLKHETGQMTDIERGRWLPVIARRLKRRIRRAPSLD